MIVIGVLFVVIIVLDYYGQIHVFEWTWCMWVITT